MDGLNHFVATVPVDSLNHEDFCTQLSRFIARYATNFSLHHHADFTSGEQVAFLKYAIAVLSHEINGTNSTSASNNSSNNSAPQSHVRTLEQLLQSIRIMTRTRRDLDRLYTPAFFDMLAALIGSPPSDSSLLIVLQLFTNLAIIDRKSMHAALPHSTLFTGLLSLLHRGALDPTRFVPSSSSSGSEMVIITAQSLFQTLQFICSEAPFGHTAATVHGALREVAVLTASLICPVPVPADIAEDTYASTFAISSSPSASSTSSSSASSSSSSSSSVSSTNSLTDAPSASAPPSPVAFDPATLRVHAALGLKAGNPGTNERRKAAADAIRLLYILCNSCSEDELTTHLEGVTALRLIASLAAVLTINIPMQDLIFTDFTLPPELEEQLEITEQTETKEVEEVRRGEPEGKDDRDFVSTKDDGWIPSSSPAVVNLYDLKFAAMTLTVFCPKDGTRLLSRDLRTVHFLTQALERVLVEIHADEAHGTSSDGSGGDLETTRLSPLVMALDALVQKDEKARAYVKCRVFGKYAFTKEDRERKRKSGRQDEDAIKTKEQKGGVEEEDDEAEKMRPDGAESARVIDSARPLSLRSLLTGYMTSFDWTLKRMCSDLLHHLSEDTDDFIRLTGFGNAIGLLTEKGLPGFVGLQRNAVSLDDLAQAVNRK